MTTEQVANVPSVDPEARYRVRVTRDARIPTTVAGLSLSADVFVPLDAGPVPALVMVLPYRKDAQGGALDAQTFLWFAARGYACVLVDFRGTGSSDGEQRPPFDPGEADDGVAAVEWAAAQVWCNGNVGMWGHSYGAVMSMRTASRRPPHLRAILPVMGMVDPELDLVHPCGARGLATITAWGMFTLLNQLVPPLHDYGSHDEHERWRRRLHDSEPWIIDILRHGPGDPAWRARAVDVSLIQVPTFCVGGWRDIFCEGTLRAYEQITAPKKLLVGPWVHTMPDASPFQPVDFRGLSLQWWDHWLNGVPNGVMDEAPVTLYLQGDEPHWQRFEAWPPANRQVRFATEATATLHCRDRAEPAPPVNDDKHIAEGRLDATAGVLSQLWALPADGTGLPLDQHDDDMRAPHCDSEPLAEDLIIAGRCDVTVRMAGVLQLDRLTVRLADVDGDGRSTLIAGGIAARPTTRSVTLALTPTFYRVASGHRLRVVVTDAEFPRLWPAMVSGEPILRLAHVEVVLPKGSDGVDVSLARPPITLARAGTAGGPTARGTWMVARDLVNNRVEVCTGGDLTTETPAAGHLLVTNETLTMSVAASAPTATHAHAKNTATVTTSVGDTIAIAAESQITSTHALVRADVELNGKSILAREWHTAVGDGTNRTDGRRWPMTGPATPMHRVDELLAIYGDPHASVATLLCDRHPADAPAFTIVEPDGLASVLTYGQLRSGSQRLAGSLQALGIGVGDRVATLMGKSSEYVITLLAIWRLGAVHVPLFTAFAPGAIGTRLLASAAKAVVCDVDQRDKLRPSDAIPSPAPWRVIVNGRSPGRARGADLDLEDMVAAGSETVAAAALGPTAPMVHIYTSGTTGRPKGVVVPTVAIASFHAYLEFGCDIRRDDVYWNAADPGWAYGLYYGIIGALAVGVPAVLLKGRFSAELTWSTLRDQGVTNFAAAPTVYRALKAADLAPTELRLRCASSAGEPLTPDVNDWARGALGVAVHDHYGQTETGMLVNNHHHPAVSGSLTPGSMGRPMPGWTVRVLEQDRDEEAEAGTTGRLAVDLGQSPLAWFAGYADDPDNAERFTADRRFYLTGDLARVGASGDLEFAGRADDVIIMAGYRIGPFDVESTLARHPSVKECAVIAVPDHVRGEVLEAYVVLTSGWSADAELVTELQQWVKGTFAAHAYPRAIHFVDSLPKTPSGKVQRFVLRERRRAELAPASL